MLELMKDIRSNVVGVRATGKVTSEEYEKVLIPAVAELSKRAEKINLLILLETDVSHFTLGAWMEDMFLGLKHFTRWNRVAIVSDQKGVQQFTNLISNFVPGHYKGFPIASLELAKQWVAAPKSSSQNG